MVYSGNVVVKAVMSCPHLGKMIPHELNETFLVLILKKEKSVKVTEYRPISLCNVVYKIIAKLLLIDWSLFCHKWLVKINVLLFRVGLLLTMFWLHLSLYILFESKREVKCVLLNLDMSKAYNKVEWCFLEKFMLKLGFDAKRVDMVLSCINSVHMKFCLTVLLFLLLVHQEDCNRLR